MQRAVEEALRGFSAEPFENRAVVVVVPDATRPLPIGSIEPLMSRLSGARRLRLVVGLGLHRALLPGERAPYEALAQRWGAELFEHDPHDPARLAGGFFDVVSHAERLVLVGLVEPHQYAGFSGGIKAISIGCASGAHIAKMHGLRFLRDPKTRLGALDGNPFQRALWAHAQPLLERAPIFALQLVPAAAGSDGAPKGFWGPVQESFQRAAQEAKARHFIPVERPLDWVHLQVSGAKAQSFYQASRAASYVALVERCALSPGATIMLEAACPEGLGKGAGERAFAKALSPGPEALRSQLRSGTSNEAPGGAQRAYVLAMTLQRAKLALVGSSPIPELEDWGILSFQDADEASSALGLSRSSQRSAVLRNVFHAVPQLSAAGGEQ